MMRGCQCRSPATTMWLMLNNVSRLSPKVDSCLLKGSMVTICGESLGSFRNLTLSFLPLLAKCCYVFILSTHGWIPGTIPEFQP